METQWQELLATRQKLQGYADQLRKDLNGFNDLPDVRSIGPQIDEAKQTIANIRRESGQREQEIRPRIARLHFDRLTMRRNRLKKQERSNAPAPIIAKEKELIAQALTPELCLLEEMQAMTNATVAIISSQLATLQRSLRERKKLLKLELDVACRGLEQHGHEELQWGTQTELHLRFFLEKEPARRAAVIALFQKRWPQHSIAGLVPMSTPKDPTRSISNGPSKRARRRNAEANSNQATAGLDNNVPWRLTFTDETQREQTLLPDDHRAAAAQLQACFQKHGIKVDAQYTLERLVKVTRMNLQDRQQLNKMHGGEPKGWRIVHIGKYRAFLDIDEAGHTIRFLIRRRRDAYMSAFRSR